MEKFKKGNIVKLGTGSIVIIDSYRTVNLSNESYKVVDWISFDSSNCGGCNRVDTYETEEMCWECGINDGGYKDEECECCKGTGYYTATILGMDKSTILADNARSYIIKTLTKNFDF